MKRNWFLGFWVLVFVSALGRGVLADPVARQADLTGATGQVEWLKAGTSDWQTASLNQKLESGDKIRTGENGSATLTLDDGSTIQVAPGSEFSIQTLTKDSASAEMQTVLAVLKGRVRSQVTPMQPGSSFEIETPILVASVLGTTFNVGVNPDGSVSVMDEDGNVVASGGGEVPFKATLDSGDSILVTKNPDGSISVKNVSGGPVTVAGGDGNEQTLNPGDEVNFSEGAATFIPNPDPTNAPGSNPAGEATGTSTDDTSGPSSPLTTPPSET